MIATSRASSRAAILAGAMALARGGHTISLESVARAAGLTKPGLMYHFPTKEALMTGLVDHLVDGYERELRARLPEPPAVASVEQRLGAYLDWTFTATIDQADLIMFTDPRLREHLTTRWEARMRSWVGVPDDLPMPRRARLLAVRLIADGSWFADATGVLPLTADERRATWELGRALLEDRR